MKFLLFSFCSCYRTKAKLIIFQNADTTTQIINLLTFYKLPDLGLFLVAHAFFEAMSTLYWILLHLKLKASKIVLFIKG